MNSLKSSAFTASIAVLLTLAGCQRTADPGAAKNGGEATTAAGSEAVGPDAKPGIALTEARLLLPAVKGRPAAAYFTLRNGSARPATLVAVFVDGAKQAEMHETNGGAMAPLRSVEIAGGGTVTFAPGGKHLMVFDPGDRLRAGGTTELTLGFADGDKLSAPLAIRPAGSAVTMPGMQMDAH